MESCGQQSELRVHYWSRERGPHSEVFPYSLADGRWHKLSLAVGGARVALHVDCNREGGGGAHPSRLIRPFQRRGCTCIMLL